MKRLGEAARRLADSASLGCMFVGGLAAVAMMVQVTADVAAKYLFAQPIPMTLEIVAHYYMVAIVFLPLAIVERRDAHIDVDILMRHAPPRLDRVARRVACLIGFAVFAPLAVHTFGVALEKHAIGEIAMGSHAIILWPTRYLLPLGAGLYALVLLLRALLPERDTSEHELETEHAGG